MKKQNLSRRQFIGTSLLAAAGITLASKSSLANSIFVKGKPNSKINGVQIGVITYSFRSMPGSIEQILQYCIDCDINDIELMGDAAEAYAGAPKYDNSADFGTRMAQWRESTLMDPFIAIRKMYNNAGVNIYAWKPNALNAKNTDAEITYAFNAGKALGCTHVTVELPDEMQTQRLGDLAEKADMMVGYHAHTQATPTLWDAALSQNEHNGISMHLKDRKFHDGPNMPWGQGDTPIKEVLVLMKQEGYKFPATIEQEYKIPDGSDAVKEVKICREYARKALS
jgi:hypothetical protein